MPAASQPKFKILVANFSEPMPSSLRGSLPKIGPVKTRTGFEFRHVLQLGFVDQLSGSGESRSVVTRVDQANFDPFLVNPPQRPTGQVTVANNAFVGTSASLLLGLYELVSNRDYVVGGGAAATAANLAIAISNLPGYDAVAAGPTITVEGPPGTSGDALRFRAVYRGGSQNFTFTFVGDEGKLGYVANNPVQPPTILPP